MAKRKPSNDKDDDINKIYESTQPKITKKAKTPKETNMKKPIIITAAVTVAVIAILITWTVLVYQRGVSDTENQMQAITSEATTLVEQLKSTSE